MLSRTDLPPWPTTVDLRIWRSICINTIMFTLSKVKTVVKTGQATAEQRLSHQRLCHAYNVVALRLRQKVAVDVRPRLPAQGELCIVLCRLQQAVYHGFVQNSL